MPSPGKSRAGNRDPECHSPGPPGEAPCFASALQAGRNPRPQALASSLGISSREPDFGAVCGVSVLLPSREHQPGSRRARSGRRAGTPGSGKVLLLFLRNP